VACLSEMEGVTNTLKALNYGLTEMARQRTCNKEDLKDVEIQRLPMEL
jgi:hypothetical protein